MHTLDAVSPALGAAAMAGVALARDLPAAAGWPAVAVAVGVCAVVMRLAGPVPGVLASAALHGLLTRGGRAPSPAADAAAAAVLYVVLALTAVGVALVVGRVMA